MHIPSLYYLLRSRIFPGLIFLEIRFSGDSCEQKSLQVPKGLCCIIVILLIGDSYLYGQLHTSIKCLIFKYKNPLEHSNTKLKKITLNGFIKKLRPTEVKPLRLFLIFT